MKTKSNNTVKKIDGLATQMETSEIIEGNVPAYWDVLLLFHFYTQAANIAELLRQVTTKPTATFHSLFIVTVLQIWSFSFLCVKL